MLLTPDDVSRDYRSHGQFHLRHVPETDVNRVRVNVRQEMRILVGGEASTYEILCEEEMAAAESTPSHEARLVHLEMALRFAILAHKARQKCETVERKTWNAGDFLPE